MAPRSARVLAVAPLVAGLLAMGSGCGSGSDDVSTTTTPRPTTRLSIDEQRAMVSALCESDRTSRAGDPVLGRAIYFEHAHESLHLLIEDVERSDEVAGARLEGAHNQLETAFAYLKQNAEITAELDLFRSALEAGSRVVGVETTCP